MFKKPSESTCQYVCLHEWLSLMLYLYRIRAVLSAQYRIFFQYSARTDQLNLSKDFDRPQYL